MLVLRRMDGNDPAITARFAAGAEAAAVALAAARRFADAAGLAPDPRTRLAIIVEELVINIVEHGGAPGAPIELTLAARGNEIGLTLIDEGRIFDPRLAEPPATMPERGGGVGLALVRAWTRIDDYAQEGRRNRLKLTLSRDGGTTDPER